MTLVTRSFYGPRGVAANPLRFFVTKVISSRRHRAHYGLRPIKARENTRGRCERRTDPQMAACRCRRGLHRLRTLRLGLWSRLSRNPEPCRYTAETRRLRQRRTLHPGLPRGSHPYGLGAFQRRSLSRLLAVRRTDPSRILFRARRNSRLNFVPVSERFLAVETLRGEQLGATLPKCPSLLRGISANQKLQWGELSCPKTPLFNRSLID